MSLFLLQFSPVMYFGAIYRTVIFSAVSRQLCGGGKEVPWRPVHRLSDQTSPQTLPLSSCVQQTPQHLDLPPQALYDLEYITMGTGRSKILLLVYEALSGLVACLSVFQTSSLSSCSAGLLNVPKMNYKSLVKQPPVILHQRFGTNSHHKSDKQLLLIV